jgi:hypothetical protein
LIGSLQFTKKQEIPILFAGNKTDLSLEKHLVAKEEVTEWVYCELPRLRTKVSHPFPRPIRFTLAAK